MFCIQLNGGLGNQMFQYAFGRAIAEKYKTHFSLDSSLLENHKQNQDDTIRNFELAIFQQESKRASKQELAKFKKTILLNKIKNKFKIPFLPNSKIILEKNLKLNNNFFKRKNFYFVGYWQSEHYFESIENIIRSDFIFKTNLSDKNKDLKNQLDNTNSVSIHIRRGDYVSNQSASKNHGTCSVEYYRKAIETIKDQVLNPVFYIFSDDFEWVKKSNLGVSEYEVIDWNIGEKSYLDMQMMSYCKHNIIANSSFSWWGAWLNSFDNKIVIAPQRWFVDNLKNSHFQSLMPKKWLKL